PALRLWISNRYPRASLYSSALATRKKSSGSLEDRPSPWRIDGHQFDNLKNAAPALIGTEAELAPSVPATSVHTAGLSELVRCNFTVGCPGQVKLMLPPDRVNWRVPAVPATTCDSVRPDWPPT